jgi:hypothetical protein
MTDLELLKHGVHQYVGDAVRQCSEVDRTDFIALSELNSRRPDCLQKFTRILTEQFEP